jgi:hypothetical protein
MPGRPADELDVIAKLPKARTAGDAVRNGPIDLANYLRARSEEIAEIWSSEIRARNPGKESLFDPVVGRFTSQFTALLPWLLGPHGTHIKPLWDRTAELFGVMAAKRGLAAGEVIEEFQILRELLIRSLFRDPPPERSLSLRDTLRINRIVDSGVTLASVGHTDAMFFQLLEAQESAVDTSPETIVREADVQLALVEAELLQILGVTSAESSDVPGH